MIVRHSPGAQRINRRGDKALRRLRRRHARVQRDAAYRAKRNRPPLRHRRPHHPPIRGTRSASKSKRVEGSFGWGKTIGGLARPIVPIANVIRFGERRRIG